MTERQEPAPAESPRVAATRSRAGARLERQRDLLRPVGLAMIAGTGVGAFSGHPAPGRQGQGLGVGIALAVVVATLAVAISRPFVALRVAAQAAVILAMGGAGVALTALQPQGATELAGAAAVWIAMARLPLRSGLAVGSLVAAALAAAAAVSSRSPAVVLAETLLCVLLALVARFLKQARESQDRTELLLAQLEDAREEQTRAAAVAERGRIAGELHDVLAHSLSGAAIQLQGARMLAEREGVGAPVRTAIDRASDLVKDGLASARQAVAALRGDEMPGVGQLEMLVVAFRRDLNVAATLRVEGEARHLPAEASLALYRGAQEALTNIARHAPGAPTSVVLRYDAERTTVTVENGLPVGTPGQSGSGDLSRAGGGRGLRGLRERLERVGGSMRAGPTADGWCVAVEVPL